MKAMLAVAAIVVFGVLGVWSTRARPGPLRTRDGGDVHAVAAFDATRTELSDGSVIALSKGAAVDVLDNSAQVFATLVTRGEVAFDVHPGGPRRWIVECGLATVEVVGTRFVVDRADDRVTVRVERGAVLVRSASIVPDRVRRLTAGESVTIAREVAHVPEPTPSAPASIAVIEPPAPSPSPSTPTRPAWRELATKRDFSGAYRALGAAGIAAETSTASVDELFTLADVARLSGHPADAVVPLRRIAQTGGSRGALGAFTLAKIELDSLGRAGEAADDFGRTIAMGVPGALVEDAHARRVEALARAGRREAARDAADAFSRSFPGSSRRSEVARWAE
jgi:transmembrane sensor